MMESQQPQPMDDDAVVVDFVNPFQGEDFVGGGLEV